MKFGPSEKSAVLVVDTTVTAMVNIARADTAIIGWKAKQTACVGSEILLSALAHAQLAQTLEQ